MTYEELLQDFRQSVERSIADALRVPARNSNPGLCAREVYDARYKDVLHESVLDEFNDREEIIPGRYTPPASRL